MSTNTGRDAFDQWWEWAQKPVDSVQTIAAVIHNAVMALSPQDRRDRQKANDAARRNAWREMRQES
jgi:hypothetical protein